MTGLSLLAQGLALQRASVAAQSCRACGGTEALDWDFAGVICVGCRAAQREEVAREADYDGE